VVEVAGIVPVVVHGRVHRRDQPTVAAGVAGQVQWLTVAVAQVSKQPGNPGGQGWRGGHGAHRWGRSAELVGAPTRCGAGSAWGGNRRWAIAVGTTAAAPRGGTHRHRQEAKPPPNGQHTLTALL
jgi:hypothetical protein